MAILASVGLGVVNVVFTVVAMQLIDHVGRRPLLLVSLAGMALSLIVLGLSSRRFTCCASGAGP